MLVSDVIKQVALGDIKSLSLSDCIGSVDATGNIQLSNTQLDNQSVLVNFLNLGVLELHKRFPLLLQTKSFSVDVDDINTPVKLPDTALNLIKVYKTEDPAMEELPIDNVDKELNFRLGVYKDIYIKTIAINTYLIQGKYDVNGEADVTFQFTTVPSVLTYKSTINIPMSYLEALLNYIAYRSFSSIVSTPVQGAPDRGMEYKKKFEDSCLHLKEITDSLYEPLYYQRLEDRCFV